MARLKKSNTSSRVTKQLDLKEFTSDVDKTSISVAFIDEV